MSLDTLTSAPPASPRPKGEWIAPISVAAVVTAAYVMFAAWQWNRIVVKSWDLGIFTQLLQSYAQFQPPIVNIKGDGFNLLGDHFHPLLVLLTPVFAIFPHAFTLLVIQAVCFGVSAGMLTAVSSRRLGTRVGGILLGVAFGLSWGLQYAAEAQFHEIALAVPLLTGALSAILERRWQAAAMWAVPLVVVKEDLGLTVMVIGLLVARLSRNRRYLWLAVWGVGWSAIAMLLILPALNPNGAWAYAANANPTGLLADAESWFDPAKGHTLTLVLVTTAGFLLRSPLALTLLPTLAWRLLSTNPGYWGPTWHYSAVLMPIAFAVVIDGIQRASSSEWAWLRSYARHGAAVAITVSMMLLPQQPLADMITPDAWKPVDRADAAAKILKSVPDGASVESDIGLMNYVVDDHDVYWIGNPNPAADCILIDRAAGGTPNEWGDVLSVGRRLHPTAHYAIIEHVEDYQLACKSGGLLHG